MRSPVQIWLAAPYLAAIAQPVERILGKDEVASSNLASSSKDTPKWKLRSFLLYRKETGDLIPCPKGKFKREVERLPRNRRFRGNRVASSNLASSSKPLIILENQGFFLFLNPKSDRILLPHITGKDAVYTWFKIQPYCATRLLLSVQFPLSIVFHTVPILSDFLLV